MALDKLDASSANGFSVNLDGVNVPHVTKVSGLTREVETIELKQQDDKGGFVVRKLIGRAKPGSFTVTRGLTDSKTINDWLKTVMEGDVAGARKTAAVALLDYQGNTLITYNFTNCWVSKVSVSSLEAGSTSIATEEFTINFDESSVS